MKTYSIYGLFDPRNPLDHEYCRYIGKTTIPIEKRLDQHVEMAETGKQGHRNNWIRKLLREGVTPVVLLLDKAVDDSSLDQLEKDWIAKGRANDWRLTNMTDGGDGSAGYRWTDEQRAAQSIIKKQQHIDDPTIAERIRQAGILRYSDPEARRILGEKISEAILAMDKSDVWCPDCGDGPFLGNWGLVSHRKYDHDPQPEMCPDCGDGPFLGHHGVVCHQQHKHWTTKDPLMCEACGDGPFDGRHGIGIHAAYCSVLNPGASEARSAQFVDLYANNPELRDRLRKSGIEAKANEDKTPTMCVCGDGPFIGPRALLNHQARSTTCTESRVTPELAQKQSQRASDMAAQFAKANGAAAAKRIRKCDECDLVTNAGALGGHQKRTGHTGWTTISTN